MTTKTEANYQEFDKLPDGWKKIDPKFDMKNVDPHPMKWSGDSDPPALYSEIVVTMNGLGPAIVTGYFVEYGWLGILVQFKKPPKWWQKQNNGYLGPMGYWLPKGHVFGIEYKVAA